ncbi:MAG: EAL domain-containing protein [Aquimonas sp.]|nr:EAL domain-containing protein [Aquimonas sp.]
MPKGGALQTQPGTLPGNPTPAASAGDTRLLSELLDCSSVQALGDLIVSSCSELGLQARVLHSMRWPDALTARPEARPGQIRLQLAEAALSAADGTAQDASGNVMALALATHASGAAAVLLLENCDKHDLPRLLQPELSRLLAQRYAELFEQHALLAQIGTLEHAERLQRALFAITDIAASDLDMAEMLRGLHGIIGSLMYAENLYIVEYDRQSESLQFLYFHDHNDASMAVDLYRRRPLESVEHGLTWHVLRGALPLRGSLDEIRQVVLHRAPLRSQGTAAHNWLGVPMLADGEVRGMMAVQTYTEAVQFTEADQALLGFVASHILTALDRRRSRAELEALVASRTRELAEANRVLQGEVSERERGERLQAALYRIAELSGHDVGLEDFCASVHAIVGQLIEARNFYIAMVSDDGETLNFPYCADETHNTARQRPMGMSITEYVIRSGAPLLADREQLDRLIADGVLVVRGSASVSWLGVPLIGSEGVLGAVVVQSYSEHITYGANDQNLLSFVSYHIATSLERRRAASTLREANVQLEHRVEQRTRELREQIRAREAIQAQLEHQVLHDSLTGLPNRGYLRDRLARVLGRVRRHPDQQFALLYLDVDRFKVINDSLGHSAGDEVLKEVSQRFLACVRESDVVARLGGDEFAILLEDIEGADTPILVAQRVIEALAAPIPLLDSTVQPSASIGIAIGSTDTPSGEDLLRDADTAMYRAKSAGRNRYQFFEQGLDAASKVQLALELDLRQALAGEEFEAHFQDIVDLASAEVVGYEALMRWRHPRRGLLGPADFLHVAEDSGMIEAIDWQVFRRACRALARMQAGAGFVTLNVSARHFGSEGFASRLVEMIEQSGLSPSRVHIELTEGTLLRNPERVRAELERLHARGVLTALDDFGTGYSSLSYLHQFPLQMLKIDRAFVTPLESGGAGSGEAIVSAILAMSRSLDLEVVAEGIETETQRQRLLELGCRLGQGYLFARPHLPGSPPI